MAGELQGMHAAQRSGLLLCTWATGQPQHYQLSRTVTSPSLHLQ